MTLVCERVQDMEVFKDWGRMGARMMKMTMMKRKPKKDNQQRRYEPPMNQRSRRSKTMS